MTKKTFMQGAVVLGIAGIIIKTMGAVFRIPLGNIIKSQGMSYYQTAYPIYVLFLTIATAGIPVAVSRLVSERLAVKNYEGAHRVFRVSFILMFLIGTGSFSICFFGAEAMLQHLPGMEKAVFSMRAIAPALLFVPIMAAFRGYFQGMQNMKPTAASQIVEQFVRVGVGLTLAIFFLSKGVEYAAAGAAFGATAGSIGGVLIIIIIYNFQKKNLIIHNSESLQFDVEAVSSILKKILIIAIPITIGASIMPIMTGIDLVIITNRLTETGWSATEVKQMYGTLTGYVNPLINLPQVLTQAVAMSLVPAATAAFKLKDIEFLQHNIKLGLRTAIIIGLPCAFGMMTLSNQIMMMFFPADPEGAAAAGPVLFVTAFGIIFLSTVQTLTGVLQGIGKQHIPVLNLAIGALAKIIITYTLTGIPLFNIKGAAIGTVTAYIIASTLNIIAVKKYTGTKFDMRITFVKPVLSAITMSIVVFITYNVISLGFGNTISTFLAVIAGACVYLFMLLSTKAITEEELLKMPKGSGLVKIINKIKGIRNKAK